MHSLIIITWKYLFLLQIVPCDTEHNIIRSTGQHNSTPSHTLRPIMLLCSISKFLFETQLWVFRAIFFICTSDFMWMLCVATTQLQTFTFAKAAMQLFTELCKIIQLECSDWILCYELKTFCLIWSFQSVLDDVYGLQGHKTVLTANLLLILWRDLLLPSSWVIQE